MQKPFVVLFFATASVVALYAKAGAIPSAPGNSFIGSPKVVPSPPAPGRDEVIRFWTPARMAAAWPVANPPPYQGGTINDAPFLDPGADLSGYTLMPVPYVNRPLSRITGILFFHVADNDPDEGVHHCSASVIHSKSQNLILTAAHCVHAGQWYDMLMFVPAFDGRAPVPLEKWPIRRAFIPAENAGDSPETDIAVASVYPLPSGKTLEAEVGDAFRPHVSTTELFPLVKDIGYPGTWIPGDDPYLFAQQRQCDSHTSQGQRFNTLLLLNCTPQGGNSGGPVVRVYSSPIEVVAVFVNTVPLNGQTRLLPKTFIPIYEAADSLAP